jgi:hypothetical protein
MGKDKQYIELEVFNAATQKKELVKFTIDQNDELVGTFKTGNVLKIPASVKGKDAIYAYLDKHEAANKGQIPAPPEIPMADRLNDRFA